MGTQVSLEQQVLDLRERAPIFSKAFLEGLSESEAGSLEAHLLPLSLACAELYRIRLALEALERESEATCLEHARAALESLLAGRVQGRGAELRHKVANLLDSLAGMPTAEPLNRALEAIASDCAERSRALWIRGVGGLCQDIAARLEGSGWSLEGRLAGYDTIPDGDVPLGADLLAMGLPLGPVEEADWRLLGRSVGRAPAGAAPALLQAWLAEELRRGLSGLQKPIASRVTAHFERAILGDAPLDAVEGLAAEIHRQERARRRVARPLEPVGPLVVRTARPEDAAELARLSELLGYPTTEQALRQRLEGLLGEPGQTALVVESGALLIGFVHAGEQRGLVEERRAEIAALVVDPQHRGRGVGRALAAQVEQWAVEHGCADVSVGVRTTLTDAHAFYGRLGYLQVKTSHKYVKSLGPAQRAP